MRLTSLFLGMILALAGPIGNAFAQRGPSTGGRGSTCRDVIGNAGIGASRSQAGGNAGPAASGGGTGGGSHECRDALMRGAKSCAPTAGGLVALGLASQGKGAGGAAIVSLHTNSAVLNLDHCVRDAREAYDVCVGSRSDRDRGAGPSSRDSGGGLISGDR